MEFIVFATFSNSGHLGFLVFLNFSILNPCSLIMLHVYNSLRKNLLVEVKILGPA